LTVLSDKKHTEKFVLIDTLMIAHEQPVNFYGSSQVGYIVLDPETGAGGYLIGGG
jgi:hypothetical protein